MKHTNDNVNYLIQNMKVQTKKQHLLTSEVQS